MTEIAATDGPRAVGSPGQVLESVPLSSAGKAIITGDADGFVLMSRLVENNLDIDALRLMPYLLPIRQAIWWGCMCSWHANGGRPARLEDEALCATVAWVRHPGEAEWNGVEHAAKADGCRSPGGCCAQAAGWTGFWSASGNWSHRDLRVAARLIAAAVSMVIGQPNAGIGPRTLLSLGVEVARGERRWEGGEQ